MQAKFSDKFVDDAEKAKKATENAAKKTRTRSAFGEHGPVEKPDLPIIVVDTSEKHPWVFEGVATIGKALMTGDYSLVGYESEITIERKSIDDWVNTITHCHERFAEEVARMKGFQESYIIIEANAGDILEGVYTRSKTNLPAMVWRRTRAFIKANPHVEVIFGGQRWTAVAIARDILLSFARREKVVTPTTSTTPATPTTPTAIAARAINVSEVAK